MPIDGNSAESSNPQVVSKKKRVHKKRRAQGKQHSKSRVPNETESGQQAGLSRKTTLNGRRHYAFASKTKTIIPSSGDRCDLNKLTPANLGSLRWDNILNDPKLESERIERYKELRRQRYADARQHAIDSLVEQIRSTAVD